jgi:hypothetical protein
MHVMRPCIHFGGCADLRRPEIVHACDSRWFGRCEVDLLQVIETMVASFKRSYSLPISTLVPVVGTLTICAEIA